MTTLQWITAFAQSMMSPLLTWLAAGLITWAVFTWRIGRVHHVRLQDITERAGETQFFANP